MGLCQLIYASQSVTDQPDLTAILATAQRKNPINGITGMLVYFDKQFMQVLEGEEANVHQLFDTIKRDPRHEDVEVILLDPVPERQFEHWHMGCKVLTLDDVMVFPQHKDCFSFSRQSALLKSKPGLAIAILLHFAHEVNEGKSGLRTQNL